MFSRNSEVNRAKIIVENNIPKSIKQNGKK